MRSVVREAFPPADASIGASLEQARTILRAERGAPLAARSLLAAGGATKPEVSWIEVPGGRLVVKDVRRMHRLVRALYGRPVLRREARTLARLEGMPGVPRWLGWIDRDAIAMSFVDAEPLRRSLAPARLRAACTQLPVRVAELHARGVVHLDLRQKRNILVGPRGDVTLVDFQSALLFRRPGRVVRWLGAIDRAAVLKFCFKYAPDLLDSGTRARARRQRFWARFWFLHRFGPLFKRAFGRRSSRSP